MRARKLSLTLATALVATAASASAALADGIAPPPTTPPTTPPATTPPPAPPAATIALSAGGLTKIGKSQYALAGQAFAVHGTVSPYVAGQTVVVRVARSSKKILVRSLAVKPGTAGVGRFAYQVKSAKGGTLSLRASHLATAQQATGVAQTVHVSVLTPSASAGQGGPIVDFIQDGLARLHYAVPHSGRYDAGTGRAVLAYRKVNDMPRVETIDKQIILRLAKGVGGFKARFPSHGRHVEGDLTHQVVVELNGATPYRIYHMSSGKPSTPTVVGHFKVYSKSPGFNSELMYDSNYFIRGYAIHGYPDVPNYPASHGCLRVNNADAPAIFAWVRVGTTVDVYH